MAYVVQRHHDPYQRMQGKKPLATGTDHAAIATQNRVEKICK